MWHFTNKLIHIFICNTVYFCCQWNNLLTHYLFCQFSSSTVTVGSNTHMKCWFKNVSHLEFLMLWVLVFASSIPSSGHTVLTVNQDCKCWGWLRPVWAPGTGCGEILRRVNPALWWTNTVKTQDGSTIHKGWFQFQQEHFQGFPPICDSETAEYLHFNEEGENTSSSFHSSFGPTPFLVS